LVISYNLEIRKVGWNGTQLTASTQLIEWLKKTEQVTMCLTVAPSISSSITSSSNFKELVNYYCTSPNSRGIIGARGSVVCWGTMLEAGRSPVRFPMRSLNFFNFPNPSSCNMALGSIQPLTEMSTR
jgi:hypothetical protein